MKPETIKRYRMMCGLSTQQVGSIPAWQDVLRLYNAGFIRVVR